MDAPDNHRTYRVHNWRAATVYAALTIGIIGVFTAAWWGGGHLTENLPGAIAIGFAIPAAIWVFGAWFVFGMEWCLSDAGVRTRRYGADRCFIRWEDILRIEYSILVAKNGVKVRIISQPSLATGGLFKYLTETWRQKCPEPWADCQRWLQRRRRKYQFGILIFCVLLAAIAYTALWLKGIPIHDPRARPAVAAMVSAGIFAVFDAGLILYARRDAGKM